MAWTDPHANYSSNDLRVCHHTKNCIHRDWTMYYCKEYNSYPTPLYLLVAIRTQVATQYILVPSRVGQVRANYKSPLAPRPMTTAKDGRFAQRNPNPCCKNQTDSTEFLPLPATVRTRGNNYLGRYLPGRYNLSQPCQSCSHPTWVCCAF